MFPSHDLGGWCLLFPLGLRPSSFLMIRDSAASDFNFIFNFVREHLANINLSLKKWLRYSWKIMPAAVLCIYNIADISKDSLNIGKVKEV